MYAYISNRRQLALCEPRTSPAAPGGGGGGSIPRAGDARRHHDRRAGRVQSAPQGLAGEQPSPSPWAQSWENYSLMGLKGSGLASAANWLLSQIRSLRPQGGQGQECDWNSDLHLPVQLFLYRSTPATPQRSQDGDDRGGGGAGADDDRFK